MVGSQLAIFTPFFHGILPGKTIYVWEKEKFRKNRYPKPEPTPFGFWREALTNKDISERAAFGFMSRTLSWT
uniref:Uncharacterized protein n=1 Tax=Candidatus Kentrum eta TaxID=2126337 RepID=A0A450V564_9GAMM|nr:MAG: hypothetical protein BECKH772A_GA0070896_100388 [Candidatus Kentron sp. H]VFJ93077.1 MAG: hypothetical protein BECKH772B_GA0070898_100388 [Candidatus Kentron sp. H]VFJ99927.1 MAG: hypothetical protein BECKH772C_GA0070978_100378 [Candidatus Kentron sp. H]